MKIIQIGSFPIDADYIKGGVEASVYGLAIEQIKGNQLSVMDIPRFDIKSDYIEKKEGFTVYRFSAGGKPNYSAIYRLKSILSIIRKQKPDICQIHSTSLFSFLLYLLLKLYRFPVVVTVHGLAHIEKQNLWRKQHSIRNLIKYISQSLTEFVFLSICPLIIVDTQYVADALKLYKKQGKIFRLPNCNVIPQGVNFKFLNLKTTPVSQQLLSVGGFSKRKGHLQLIKAMVKVNAKFPDFSLIIAGVLSDNNYYQLMKSSIKEKGLEQNIKLYPDASFEQILKFYQNAEIFVLHSEEESQGIVFCEAMAAGKPIVATNVGGIPWVVENGVNGLLSDYGDIDTFAKNIVALLESKDLRKEMAATNRIKSQKYNWKIIANEIVALYTSITKSTNQPINQSTNQPIN